LGLGVFNDKSIPYPRWSKSRETYVMDYRDATDADRRDVAVNFLMHVETFKTIEETDEILYYKDGYYQKGGENLIQKWLLSKELYGNKLEPSVFKAICEVIRGKTRVKRELFDADKNIINLRNGLYHIEEGIKTDHSRDYLSMMQKPITYDVRAKPKQWGKFLKQVLYPSEIRTAVEAAAYTFWRDNPFENYILLVGTGRNGKSKFSNGIASMHGEETISETPLSLLVDGNQFVSADLEGMDMNISTEAGSSMKNMDTIKRLTTTQNRLRVERKGIQAYKARIWAKMWMNTNNIPDSDDDSDAHWARGLIIVFPNQFLGKDADPKILEKLTTEEEKSGMFNVLMIALRRLLKNGAIYQTAKSIDERCIRNKRVKDPIAAFVDECLLFEGTTKDDYMKPEDLYNYYEAWCNTLNIQYEKHQTFVKKLKDMKTAMEYARLSKADQTRVFKGVKLSNKLLKLLGMQVSQEDLDA
jgi:putative DNA primase/helicase